LIDLLTNLIFRS